MNNILKFQLIRAIGKYIFQIQLNNTFILIFVYKILLFWGFGVLGFWGFE